MRTRDIQLTMRETPSLFRKLPCDLLALRFIDYSHGVKCSRLAEDHQII